MKNSIIKELVLSGIGAGMWEWNIESGEESWSDEFYKVLGYARADLIPNYETFINELVHPEQREMVEQKVKEHLESGQKYDVEILMKTKALGFRWYRSIGNAHFDKGVPKYMIGIIIDVHEEKVARKEKAHLAMLLEEVGEMASIGGWEVDVHENVPKWSEEVYRIHEVEIGENVSLEEAFSYFKPESQSVLQAAFNRTMTDKVPYDLILEISTAKGNSKWVRSKCRPIINQDGVIQVLRGSFQDVTEEVQRKQVSEKKNELLIDQNSRLVNFAHIITHNLRSHSGNLELMSSLLKAEDMSPAEKDEIIENVIKVSNDLSSTIHHLNNIVAVQTKVEHIKEKLNFHDLIESVKATLYINIKESNAIIKEEFQVRSVDYVPAYLESIFLNMISNAIKYRSEDRIPEIVVSSYLGNDKRVKLIFQDNGKGIDLNKHGKKVFGLYKTFHNHKDSRGVGLFLTKSQIESLGGQIIVESEAGVGTTFIITI